MLGVKNISFAAGSWGQALESRQPVRMFPPSRSREGDLAARLWGNRPVPEGASLMDELVARVRMGDVSLEPREDSGWYDHQTWSLEPLLRPERTEEAKRLAYGEEYLKHLEMLFRGVLALVRETHVKQLDVTPTAGRAMPPRRVTIDVRPDLRVEPLATHYARRADAYAFVRTVLEGAFGEGALSSLRRRTVDGWAPLDLDTELDLMEALFRGAASSARIGVGLDVAGGPSHAPARAVFDTWRTLQAGDPDLARDVRMMVPVFYDQIRRKTKVWVFLGWSRRPLFITYDRSPQVLEKTRLVGVEGVSVAVSFGGQSEQIVYPVTAEVYVSRLLNRKEFRAHCDRFKTRTPILRNLR